MKITVESVNTYHVPDYCHSDVVEPGMTLRQALKALREAGRENWGDIGTMTAMLSDGTELAVELQLCDSGHQLMSSQRIVRNGYSDYTGRMIVVREYPW